MQFFRLTLYLIRRIRIKHIILSVFVLNSIYSLGQSSQSLRTYLLDLGNPAYPTFGNWNNVEGNGQLDGSVIGDLIDTEGLSSSINFVVVDRADNNYGSGDGYNSDGYNGEALGYPASACMDSYFAWNSGGQYKFAGLNIGNTYDIKIFGSRMATTGGRVGRYTINGEVLNLDAWNNSTDQIEFTGVAPDVNGEIYMDFSNEVGSTFGYIGVIELIEHVTSTIPNVPVGLQAGSGNPSEVQLTWTDNSINEDGFIIERKINSGTYHYLDSLPTDQVTYQDETVARGNSYTYRLAAYNADTISDYSTEVTVDVENDADYSIYVNMSRDNAAPSPWNNILGVPVQGLTITNLKDAQGVSRGIDLSIVSPWSESVDPVWDDGAVTGDDSGVYPDAVMEEYYFFGYWSVPDQVEMKLSGLSPGGTYDIVFFASSIWSSSSVIDNGSTNYTINGETVSLYVQGNTTSVVTIRQVVPDANGEVLIEYSEGLGASAGYINAMEIHGYGGSGINTPSGLTTTLIPPNTVQLAWQDNSDNEDGFVIERRVTGDSLFTEIANIPVDSTQYEDTGLAYNTSYDYRVKAYNATDSSDFTNIVSSYTESLASLQSPVDFIGYSISNTSVFLKWTDVSDNEHSFEIFKDIGGDGSYEDTLIIASGTTEFLDDLLVAGQSYTYRIRSFFGGEYSALSEPLQVLCNGEGQIADSIEFSALMAIYNSTNGPSWNSNENWGNENVTFEDWYGVHKEDGDISVLNLSSNGLSGSLPDQIGELKGLRDLYLGYNTLGLFLTEAIGELINLEYFYIGYNNYESDIPNSIGNLTNLKQLGMYGNAFSNIPNSIGKLKNLTYLNLESNEIYNIPDSIGYLESVEEIQLQNNQIIDTIPASIGNLKSLKYLLLNDNEIQGQIPPEIGQLDSLIDLNLGNNQLTGTIPPELSQIRFISQLDLSNNQLTGQTPLSFDQFISIVLLDLSNNLLNGDVPEFLGRYCIKEINIANNHFTSIPNFQESCDLSNKIIHAQGNNLDFGSIEQNLNGINSHPFSVFEYNNQGLIGDIDTLECLEHNQLQIRSDIGGLYTHHQWQKFDGTSWNDIPEATDSVLTINDVQMTDSGQYQCIATNDWITDLTLTTSPKHLIIKQLDPIINNYDQVMYVSMSGIDSLAQSNKPDQPWSTPHLASVEAHTRFQSDSLKYLVYVQKGTYHDYWVTMPGIDIYFEEDAVVWYNTDTQASRSIISDWRGGAGDYKVFGKGRFYVSTPSGFDDRNAINFRSNSSLQIECKEIESFQFWNQFRGEVFFSNVSILTGEVWALNNIGGVDIIFNNCTFQQGYVGRNAKQGTSMTFNNCTFILPDIGDVEEIQNVYDHKNALLFNLKSADNLAPDFYYDYKFKTNGLTQQDIADVEFNNYNDTIHIVASFEILKAKNPWQGYNQTQYDFTFNLFNPTFIINRPNCIAFRVVWEEDNPDIDYAAEGISITGANVIAGPSGTNPVFIQADKRDSAAADIPIILYNNTYAGFTERVQRTGYYPMQLNTVDEGNVPDALELEALTAIYESLGGDNWTDNSGWLEGVTNLDFGKWKGVIVGDGDVKYISLDNNNLSGAIPAEISDLTELTNLNLWNNKINGLPDELFLLPNLWSLDLSRNELVEIPSSIEHLSDELHRYVQLNFSDNLLETLPYEIIYPWPWIIVWAENNYLDFENLCTFYDEPDTNDYNHFLSPQRSKFTETVQVTLQDNTLLDAVRVNAYGSNLYQWQKFDGTTWQNISGETSQTISISAINNDVGMYRCEVTNTTITKLTLYGPVYRAVAYVAAVSDGNWNNPSTWTGLPAGTFPNRNHIISISGKSVTVNGDFETGDIILDNAAQGTELNISGGHLQVFGTVKVQNVNPDHNDCKLEVTGSGKISVMNSNQ